MDLLTVVRSMRPARQVLTGLALGLAPFALWWLSPALAPHVTLGHYWWTLIVVPYAVVIAAALATYYRDTTEYIGAGLVISLVLPPVGAFVWFVVANPPL